MEINLRGMMATLIGFGIVVALCLWGCWELVDYFLIDDAIKVSKPLIPEIEIVVNNNVVDTLYVYRKP